MGWVGAAAIVGSAVLLAGLFVWRALAIGKSPDRANALVQALLTKDHDDWWSFLSNGKVVGGPSRPAFAFQVVQADYRIGKGVCGFDDQMFIAARSSESPTSARPSLAAATLKIHGRFHLERRLLGGDTLVERSNRSAWSLSGISGDELLARMTAMGWAVEDDRAKRG